jgi:hypothetical protein
MLDGLFSKNPLLGSLTTPFPFSIGLRQEFLLLMLPLIGVRISLDCIIIYLEDLEDLEESFGISSSLSISLY